MNWFTPHFGLPIYHSRSFHESIYSVIQFFRRIIECILVKSLWFIRVWACFGVIYIHMHGIKALTIISDWYSHSLSGGANSIDKTRWIPSERMISTQQHQYHHITNAFTHRIQHSAPVAHTHTHSWFCCVSAPKYVHTQTHTNTCGYEINACIWWHNVCVSHERQQFRICSERSDFISWIFYFHFISNRKKKK